MSSTSTFDASDHGRRVEMLRMASDCEYALVVLGRVAAALAALETAPGRRVAAVGTGFWDGPNSQDAAAAAADVVARCGEARRRLVSLTALARRDAALLR